MELANGNVGPCFLCRSSVMTQVKRSIDAKRAQLAQRFRVKQLNTMLQSAVRNKLSVETAKQAVLGIPGEEEHVPAVELHMFPQNPTKVNSEWEVLLVPTVKEAFDQTWFLCQRPELPTDLPNSKQCVAKLPFEPLPFHLSSLFGKWYLQLDRHRSSPSQLLLLMEVMLALGSLLLLALTMHTVYRAYSLTSPARCPLPSTESWSFPCSCCLTQHAYVRRGSDCKQYAMSL